MKVSNITSYSHSAQQKHNIKSKISHSSTEIKNVNFNGTKNALAGAIGGAIVGGLFGGVPGMLLGAALLGGKGAATDDKKYSQGDDSNSNSDYDFETEI